MATDFDSNAIITAGGIKPSCVDTPGDMRTRVKLLEDIMTIPLPYVGMIVYCEETDCYYKITELGPKYIGNKEIENSLVEAYEEYDINMITRNIDDTYAKINDAEFVNSISLHRYSFNGASSISSTIGEYSVALGYKNAANKKASCALGFLTESKGECSFTEGHYTVASANYSHAEGSYSLASGTCSHAEGQSTVSAGKVSHAEGCDSTASGAYSHAQNYYCKASGDNSHAEGYYTESSGSTSHAEGYHTVANGPQQHVQGKYNIKDTSGEYAHIVGNGTDTKRSNAHTVDWSGNAWYAGDVYVGADNNKLATENQINELMAIIESLQARIEELENK